MSNVPRPESTYAVAARLDVPPTASTGQRAAREVTAQSHARQIAQLRTLVALGERHGRDTTALRRKLGALMGETSPQIVSKPRATPPTGDRLGPDTR